MIGGSVFSGIGVLLLIASFATCQGASCNGQFEYDVVYTGPPINNGERRETPEQCNDLCSETPGCFGWSWGANGDQCWLKSRFEKRLEMEGRISGEKNSCKGSQQQTTTETLVTEGEVLLDDDDDMVGETGRDADYTGTVSAYCAYQDEWENENAEITYDKLTLEENTVPGAMLSTTTGKFTAGASGLYHVVASMTMVSNVWNANDVFFRLNNINLEESHMNSYVYDHENPFKHYEMGGRSMMIKMSKGDTLSLYTSNCYYLDYITFCVNYMK